jgi:hypothetical protein
MTLDVVHYGKKYYVLLTRVCKLVLYDEILYKCLLNPFVSVLFSSGISVDFLHECSVY